MGGNGCAYGGLVGGRGGKKPLGRPRHAWEDNIKMDLKKYDGNAWTEFVSGHGQVLGCCEHGYEPWSFMKCGDFLTS